MSNPWFRMYNDFLHDEAIEFLSFEDQRHFVFILCMKNSGILDKDYAKDGMLDRVVARRLGLYGEAFESAKQRLLESGLVDADWQPINWNKRQFLSDIDITNAARQKKYRDNKKLPIVTDSNVTRNVTRNVTVTVLDTDTDTDTEQKQKDITPLSRLLSLQVEDQVAKDYLAIRKLKKSPLTETAMKGLIREIGKSGYTVNAALKICCERGWVGFNPAWLDGSGSTVPAIQKVPWYETEDATKAKAAELGIPIDSDLRELRIKINDEIQTRQRNARI